MDEHTFVFAYVLVREDRVNGGVFGNGVNELDFHKVIAMHIELLWEGEFIEWGLVVSMAFDIDPGNSRGGLWHKTLEGG